MRTRHLLILPTAITALICALAVWALWPMPAGMEPWQDEVSAEDIRALATLAGRVSAEQVAEALQLIDPAGFLESSLALDAEQARVRLSLHGEDVTVSVPLRQGSAPQGARGGPGAGSAALHGPGPASLAGRRVLLDPGHHGGLWSEAEGRHIELEHGYVIREGNLSYATARLVAERLELLGALVRLTRGPPPTEPFPGQTHEAFDLRTEAGLALAAKLHRSWLGIWRQVYPARISHSVLTWARDRVTQQPSFRLYNGFDLRRRAQIAADWDADLTLSLHYNVTGDPRVNGVIVFVPGNALIGELETPAERYHAIRRILEGQLQGMIALGRALGAAMQRHFDLPALEDYSSAGPGLAKKRAIDRESGVYARNLAILRRAVGPVLLLEGPCVNHPYESTLLQGQDVWVDGTPYPARVEQYSDAVFETLRTHAGLLWRAPR